MLSTCRPSLTARRLQYRRRGTRLRNRPLAPAVNAMRALSLSLSPQGEIIILYREEEDLTLDAASRRFQQQAD